MNSSNRVFVVGGSSLLYFIFFY